MISFDKLKIITYIDFISEIKEEEFTVKLKDGEVLSYTYKQDEPYSLLININYYENELVIEFTGKILKDNYHKLINKETIECCIHNINEIGICKLDVDNILKLSSVLKCDVTKDVKTNLNIKDISNKINQDISNYKKWKCRNYNNGVCLDKVVTTPKYKRRLVIYDKQKELMKATNNNFINHLKDAKTLINKFNNTIRFELNLNTVAQIKELLKIETNGLKAVLNASTNPIHEVLSQIIRVNTNTYNGNKLEEHLKILLIKDCDNDLEKVEARIRSLVSKNTSIKKTLKPYKELYNKLINTHNNEVDVLTLVA